jgi:hypothetical protein
MSCKHLGIKTVTLFPTSLDTLTAHEQRSFNHETRRLKKSRMCWTDSMREGRGEDVMSLIDASPWPAGSCSTATTATRIHDQEVKTEERSRRVSGG